MLLNADTQLGAFGPGADPTRSRAAYPPPRLGVNLLSFLLFASWKLGLGVLETRLGVLEAGLGILEVGLSVLEARLGGPERQLGDYSMLLNCLGRFQNALGTFQEAPERETMIFQLFWEVFWGGAPCPGMPGPSPRVDCPTP